MGTVLRGNAQLESRTSTSHRAPPGKGTR
jgi:hypothetical protein